MKLTADEKNALVVWLGGQLADAQVCRLGSWKNDFSTSDLPSDLIRKLEKISDRGGTQALFHEALARHVARTAPEGLPEDFTRVCEINGFQDTLKTSKDIVQSITSYPRSYTLLLRGPQAFADASKSIECEVALTDRFGLISSSILERRGKIVHEDKNVNDYIWRYHNITNKTLASKYLYFYFMTNCGPISDFGSRHLGEFMNEVRAFYGACLAHNLLGG